MTLSSESHVALLGAQKKKKKILGLKTAFEGGEARVGWWGWVNLLNEHAQAESHFARRWWLSPDTFGPTRDRFKPPGSCDRKVYSQTSI